MNRVAPILRRLSFAALLLALAALAPAAMSPPLLAEGAAASPSLLAVGTAAGTQSYHVAFLPILNPALTPVATVRFVPERGFYDSPLVVTISSDTTGATIRYTTDGSAPSPDHGLVYGGPVPVARTSVLRALGFKPNYAPSEVTTHSYLFRGDIVGQPAEPAGFPAIWGRYPPDSFGGLPGRDVPADYAMDGRVVDDPRYRAEIRADLLALPSLSVVMDRDDLFGEARGIYANPLGSGWDWERSASAELIQADGRPGFQVNCGIRISGNWSRLPDSTLKHSFSLRFRSIYGPAKLHYALIPDSPVDKFDTVRLRGGQADSFHFFAMKAQYIHDEWGRRTQAAMGWTAARGAFVHLYLDGLYWGVYNLTEEPTASFAASHLGGGKADYDVIKDYHQVEDGDLTAYNALTETLRLPGLSMRDRYERLARLLDLPQHADYNLIQIYGANRDWPNKNWRAIRNRTLDTPFQFMVWDIEHMAQLWGFDAYGDNANTAGVDGLHGWLRQVPEYRLLFADRVRKHFFDGGALTPALATARYAELAAAIDGPIVAESARWGDGGPAPRTRIENLTTWRQYWKLFGVGYPLNRDDHWRPERDRLLADFFPVRTAIVLEQLCREGLYPPVVAPAFSQYGGPVSPGFRLTMAPAADGCAGSRRDGVIYYTTDGTDPRLPWSGAVAASARAYHTPLSLAGFTAVRARLLSPAGWSAQTEANFGTPRVIVSEINYNPHGGSDYEFIEFQNREAVTVDLSHMSTSGITFTMPAETRLAPGAYLVLAKDAGAFGDRYPRVAVAGLYDGKLSNQGETVTLRDEAGNVVVSVAYDDAGFWPRAPNGGGHTLVIEDPDADPNDPENWRASTYVRGSPGEADPPPPYRRVVVNEVLANSPPPLEDAIELRNLGDGPAAVGGWYLSDDPAVPRKYRIPDGTDIAPGGYAVVYAAAFGADPDTGFGLSSKGETVILSSADGERLTGYMAGASFDAAEPGVSWGRHRTSAELEFVPLAGRTFGIDDPLTVEAFRAGRGGPNTGPRFGPVVMSEVMYHPADGRAEFIELFNGGPDPVPLYDPDHPANTWQFTDGIQFAFPPQTVLQPGEFVLLAGGAPDAFRRQYDLPAEVVVLGPFSGSLNNGGERVVLARPGVPDGVDAPYTAVDWLGYDDGDPWPTAADGLGPSLERLDVRGYGNEPRNWSALTTGGTPGRANTVPLAIYLPGVPNG